MSNAIGTLAKRLLAAAGYRLTRSPDRPPADRFDEDGLSTVHRHDFVADAAFEHAYRRGVRSAGADYRWRWRVHIGLWAAATAARLDADFVECGVNRGFLSSAIMTYLDWDRLGRTFYLLDTFRGLDERLLSEEERRAGAVSRNRELLETGFYVAGAESVKANFAEWKNVRLIEGVVPATLALVESERVGFLHLDMNSVAPELAALEYFWDRLVPGALVLMDDYGNCDYAHGERGLRAFAERHAVSVAMLPTGQGLVIRPPRTPR